ncbi:hypothetical protein HDV00_000215 [Rhizophlyctis rosea]|nr:hypothetical protein HDV00_000215 [Rhizophlyctis rosea]
MDITVFGEHLRPLVMPNLMYTFGNPQDVEGRDTNAVLWTIAGHCPNLGVLLMDCRMAGQSARGLRVVLEGCPKVRIGWVPGAPMGVAEEVLDGLREMGRLYEGSKEGMGICQRLSDFRRPGVVEVAELPFCEIARQGIMLNWEHVALVREVVAYA